MVSFCCEIFLLCLVAAVLTFFIAGLLFICASSTSITWERTASRPETGLLIPSGYVNYETDFLRKPKQVFTRHNEDLTCNYGYFAVWSFRSFRLKARPLPVKGVATREARPITKRIT